MGWLLGLAGKYSETELQKLNQLHPSHLYFFKSENLYLAAGGIPETCLGSVFQNNLSGWVVCGLGIQYDNDGAAFMNKKNWEEELSEESFNPYRLNGHFAAVRWDKDKVELFTDQLGIRKIYLTMLNGVVAFSTRPDWIIRLSSNISINWEILGSKWLLFNQITPNIFLNGIEDLNQGGKSVINLNKPVIKIYNQAWHPDLVPETDDKDYLSLASIFTASEFSGKTKSLALSGGLDSRILLSFLISSGNKNYSVHTFNFKEHLDTVIAEEISSALKLEHTSFEPGFPAPEKLAAMLTECIAETYLVSPASKFLLLQFYSVLSQKNKVVIDGAYGELSRRRFLNRLIINKRKAILNGEPDEIIPLLKFNRANIFNEHYLGIMDQGTYKQIEEVFKSMPEARSFGVENWVDLFAIRNRFLQSSAEQARSDRFLVNYMPFVQPYYLKKVFGTPVSKRNNKSFYKRIKELYFPLSKYPLVKGDITYPFGLGNLSTSLFVRIKGKFGYGYNDDLTIRFLNSMSEYIQDTINSNDFLTCDYYDHNKIKNIVDGFYRDGNTALAGQVDWWFTFDIWRKAVLS